MLTPWRGPMTRWPRWPNPGPSYGLGAAVGAVGGALAFAFLGVVGLRALTDVQYGSATATVDQIKRQHLVFGLMLAAGAGMGAYLGAVPHQRWAAAFGATALSAVAWTAYTWRWKGEQLSDVGTVGAVILAPAVGAFIGAVTAGTMPESVAI